MVGWRTVNADNPRLTVRAAHVERQPWRVIVDSQGQAQLEREVFCDEHKTRTLVLTSDRSPAAWRKELAARGVSVVLCALQGERIGLAPALQKLGDRDITSVLVEGGGELIGALMDARLVDKLVFFYAPKIIGGRAAPTAVEGEGITALNDAVALHNVAWHRVGDDLVVSGYCK
jgi:diaminohydroxyphosphoribosylaminopyrimidine deaminase/5-amino-6-(5-phosphoribosylamino)uracil reductase